MCINMISLGGDKLKCPCFLMCVDINKMYNYIPPTPLPTLDEKQNVQLYTPYPTAN